VKNRRHRTVVVAGPSPGVGRLIARQVARAGARFALINPASRLMPVIAGGLILFGLSLLARRGALRLASVPRHLPGLVAGLAEVVQAARPRPARRAKARPGGRLLPRPSKTKKPRRRA
jgi:NAD(P)-dependent dehydrogenase (short-subunit alcohol dehydrogenase family)